MIPTENELIRDAQKGGYAIPAFNFSDIWELLGILEAAKEENARVYAATNMKVVKSLGAGFCAALGRQAYEQSGKNVLLHLDHADEVEWCKTCVDVGYHSVMVDASACSLEENIAKSLKIAEYAHKRGCLVEAELGRIMGNTMEGKFSGGDFLADVDECVRLVRETGVDSLAVGIGNAHGFYAAPPKLNIQRLKEIHAAVDIPLVLHGGTGIPDDQVVACIENGVAKINVGTQLHSAYLGALDTELKKTWNGYNIMERFDGVRSAVKTVCVRWIRLCGANGSALES